MLITLILQHFSQYKGCRLINVNNLSLQVLISAYKTQ